MNLVGISFPFGQTDPFSQIAVAYPIVDNIPAKPETISCAISAEGGKEENSISDFPFPCVPAFFGRWSGGTNSEDYSDPSTVVDGTLKWLPAEGCRPVAEKELSIYSSRSAEENFEGECTETVAAVNRGGCSFGTKAINAAKAGAVALIVVNAEEGNEVAFAMATTDTEAKVLSEQRIRPVVVMVSKSSAAKLLLNTSAPIHCHSNRSHRSEAPSGVRAPKVTFRRATPPAKHPLASQSAGRTNVDVESEKKKKKNAAQKAQLYATMAQELATRSKGNGAPRLLDAISQLEVATSLDPDHPRYWLELLWLRQDVCAWQDIDSIHSKLETALILMTSRIGGCERGAGLRSGSDLPELAQRCRGLGSDQGDGLGTSPSTSFSSSSSSSLCRRLSPALALPSPLVTKICALEFVHSPPSPSTSVDDGDEVKESLRPRQEEEGGEKKKEAVAPMASHEFQTSNLRVGLLSSFLLEDHPLRHVLGGSGRALETNDLNVTCIHMPSSSSSSSSSSFLGCHRELSFTSERWAVQEEERTLRNEFRNLDVLLDIDALTRPSADQARVDKAARSRLTLWPSPHDTAGASSWSGPRSAIEPPPPFVQVHYLGTPQYPLMTGSTDYFASDSTLTPPDTLGHALTPPDTLGHAPRAASSSFASAHLKVDKLLLLPHYMPFLPPPTTANTDGDDNGGGGGGGGRRSEREDNNEEEEEEEEALASFASTKNPKEVASSGKEEEETLPGGRDRLRQHVRSEIGVEHDTFLFACFNQAKKINPSLFSVWMQVLATTSAAPRSRGGRRRVQLWLPQVHSQSHARRSLLAEACARGVPPDSLVFSQKKRVKNRRAYLNRLVAADLAFDTMVYSGGSVALEVLLQGIPLLVLASSSDLVGARQGLSIVKTVTSSPPSPSPSSHKEDEEDEDGVHPSTTTSLASLLITHSLKDYVDVALRFALSPRSTTQRVSAALQAHCSLNGSIRPATHVPTSSQSPQSTSFFCPLASHEAWATSMERGLEAAFEVKKRAHAGRSSCTSSRRGEDGAKGELCEELPHIVVFPSKR